MEEENENKIIVRPWLRYLSWGIWLSVIAGVLGVAYLFYDVSKGDIPSFADLENPQYDLASVLYDVNGKTYGKYYVENREQIAYADLSPHIVDALLATEDVRFHQHNGIDFRALVRVGLKTIAMSDESSGGGSTITQQLAKLLFSRPSLKGLNPISRFIKLVKVKLKEWIIAVKLERQYSKEEIIMMYLNKFEFINGAHGIQAASQTYFNKNQNKLSVTEAAMLVGMLKNPSLYNPVRFPEKSEKRRNVVLGQLDKYGLLPENALDTLLTDSLDMSEFKRSSHDEGPAPHFRAEITKFINAMLADSTNYKPDGTPYNIYTDGLRIYTTIDLNYQKHAEQAVLDHMYWNQERYWKVWKGMDPWSYDATPEIKDLRYSVLDRRIKESERYLALHFKHLGDVKDEIRSSINGDLPLHENAIKALIAIDRNQSTFGKESKTLKPKFESDYKELLESQLYSKLINKYVDLQNDFKTTFSTEIKMNVFDYENGEVESVMSPLDSVRFHNQHLQAGMLAVDPNSGHIKAWVGGVGFKYFKYDHVTSRRQVGSTIKPFVYATAIGLMGISPCQEYEDIQYTIAPGDVELFVDEEWSPANANEEFTGNYYNLYQGLLYSKNSISVRLVKELGNVEVIREVLHNAGINKNLVLPNGRYAVPKLPSICLGAADLSLLEMTGAYTTFANNGVYTQPIFISRIEDKNGKIIYTGMPERNIALNPLHNAVMVDMLKNNIGAGFNMGLKSVAGGKTGTTNDYSDGWFMGITPNLVVGTWVGGDDKWIRFLTLDDGQGYVMARPIFVEFMKALEVDPDVKFDTNADFIDPPIGFDDFVDCDRYKQIRPEDEFTQSVEQQANFDEFDEEFEEEFEEFEDFDEDFDEELDDELDEELDEEEGE